MKRLVFKAMVFLRIHLIFRWLFYRKKYSILMFHNPTPEAFEKSVKYLLKHYNIIALKDILLDKGDTKTKNRVVLTIDDGHGDNYNLLPIIKNYNIPITIFLTAGVIGSNRHFWFTKKDETGLGEGLKKMSNEERLEELKAIGFDDSKEYDYPQSLSLEQITEMQSCVDFQAHTITHPILPQCDDKTAREEIFGSKQMLDELGLQIYSMAYPNGDFSERDIELCKEAGYKLAITTQSGFNSSKTNPFKLYRIGTNDTEDINEFILRASGFWHFALKFKKIFS